MKKIVIVGVIGMLATANANAGWFSDLFSSKPAEPTTLAEACNIDEITAVCPEIILGQKTLVECLTDNVKTVSQKCVDYVKKQVAENNPEIEALTATIKDKTETAKDASGEKLDAAKEVASAQVATVKQQVAEKVDAAKLEIAKKLLESATTEK